MKIKIKPLIRTRSNVKSLRWSKIKQTSNRGTDNPNVKEIHKQTKLVCAVPSVLKAPFAMNHSLSRSDSTVINVD